MATDLLPCVVPGQRACPCDREPIVLSFGVAHAAETAGKVQSVNAADRLVTKLVLAEGVPVDAVKEGDIVKASYEERDGKKVVTEILISN